MSSALPLCRSSYSLLYGTLAPEQLVQKTARAGYGHLVLADRNNLYGAYDFYQAAREKGINPIIGTELTTRLGEIVLIAQNHDGYKKLSHLVTHYQLQGIPSGVELKAYGADILCLAPQDAPLDKLQSIFGDRLYVWLDYRQPSRACQIARKTGIKPVACPPVTFTDRSDYTRHRLLRAIDGGYLLKNLPPGVAADPEEYLKPSKWYNNFYAGFPEALNHADELARRCQLVFPQRKNILPDLKIEGDRFAVLKSKTMAGIKNKKTDLSGRYLARLEYELNVIKRTGFVDYFLIVSEIVDYCRANNIAVVGRGSAAGSLVTFALGITEVDPIEEGLYFERFLNEARSDCPDIDLDLDWRRRDEVIDFVYDRYGRDHVAMMATYIHFQPRLAIRESAKAMGLDPDDIDRFVKEISVHPLERNRLPSQLPERIKHRAALFEPVLQAARSIYGLPRHLSIHPGGVVITPEPIVDYVPLEKATKGLVVTQCDMYQAEKIGLVKIDLLGQRGLAVIADCHEAVRRIKGDDFTVPARDKDTFQTLQAGKTIGVFQIESPGLRALLKDLKPQELNDITLALALIRPGASESGMKQVFLDRFHGQKKTEYPHHSLMTILKETYGVFIYQEQVLLAAREFAGFNLPASDLLRRAITKGRNKSDQEQLKRRFFNGARRRGIDETVIEEVFRQLRKFAGYGFCKAHAATYGYLAYQSAYYKTHYPDIFMTAVLQNDGGYYPAAVYVAEARRLGVPVKPPDVNRSGETDTLCEGIIYLGINRVRDIGPGVVEQIIAGRPYCSLIDFTDRVRLSETQMENLIRVGFFDSLENSRPKLLWEYRLWGRGTKKSDNDLLLGQSTAPRLRAMPKLTEFSRFEIFRAEKDILDLPASFHPLSIFDTYAAANTTDLELYESSAEITVSGWLADRKRIKTRDGKPMVFLTFDSLTDTFEVVLFPELYQRYRDLIGKYRYLTVVGEINREGDNVAVIAGKIYPHPTGLKEAEYI